MIPSFRTVVCDNALERYGRKILRRYPERNNQWRLSDETGVKFSSLCRVDWIITACNGTKIKIGTKLRVVTKKSISITMIF